MSTENSQNIDFKFDEQKMKFMEKNLGSPFRFRVALMSILPMGFLSGMKITELTQDLCKVKVRYKWLNKNPYKSTFWAVLGMAAEMSSGALVTMYTRGQKPSMATIITKQEGHFYKKAVGATTFVCESGPQIRAGIVQSIASNEGVEVPCPMKGYNKSGELVAEFVFTWSFKPRTSKK